MNIDDCWMVKVDSKDPEIGGEIREADGTIRCNKRFPDMKALTDYIHAKGLKAGIYTSPGPATCGGYVGAWQHEAQDARTFAQWGFDFLKYDWCSYTKVAGGKTHEDYIKPYRIMWNELQKQDRDILFNLCQYGMDEVWKWGGSVGHSWRTTGDLGATGGRLSKGIYKVGLFNATLSEYAGPGHWNDPDYLLIGWTNSAYNGGKARAVPLTPNEEYSHVSMWAMMAAPLFYSGDMSKLSPFTLSLLCNHEVIDIDQDALGKQAKILNQTDDELILVKDMEDGSKAVGLFNLSTAVTRVGIEWDKLGLSGKLRVRDVWRQKDLEGHDKGFEQELPRHGTVMLRVWQQQ